MVEQKGMIDLGGINMPKLIDLTGQRFGRLTVIKRNDENLNRKPAWVCKCDCGNIKIVRGTDLRQGKVQSCGCLQKEKLEQRNNNRGKIQLNTTFGYLTVIKDLGLKQIYEGEIKKNRRYSLCKCICGKQIQVQNHQLKNGNVKSCGCMKYVRSKGSSIKDLTGQKFHNLTVLKDSGERDNGGQVLWLCKCSCGRTTKISTTNVKRQKTCGRCLKKQSYGVQQISLLLRKYNLKYEKQKIMPNSMNPQTKGTPRFDFYVDDDYFIEFDGKQHSIQGKGKYDNKQAFEKTKARDLFKNQWCKENNYTLIRIPYYKDDNLTIQDLIPQTSNFVVTRKVEDF